MKAASEAIGLAAVSTVVSICHANTPFLSLMLTIYIDRPLQLISKKGRPVSQCNHCRVQRKSRSAHVKCECGKRADGTGEFAHSSMTVCAVPNVTQTRRLRMSPRRPLYMRNQKEPEATNSQNGRLARVWSHRIFGRSSNIGSYSNQPCANHQLLRLNLARRGITYVRLLRLLGLFRQSHGGNRAKSLGPKRMATGQRTDAATVISNE